MSNPVKEYNRIRYDKIKYLYGNPARLTNRLTDLVAPHVLLEEVEREERDGLGQQRRQRQRGQRARRDRAHKVAHLKVGAFQGCQLRC